MHICMYGSINILKRMVHLSGKVLLYTSGRQYALPIGVSEMVRPAEVVEWHRAKLRIYGVVRLMPRQTTNFR